MVQRNLLVYKHGWMVIFSGFFEPLFYLLSLGLGLGAMVPDIGGVSYTRVRRAGPAGRELHERRDHRRVLQHLLQAALPEDLRRHSRHADARAGRGASARCCGRSTRGSLYAAAFLVVVLVLGELVGPPILLSPWAVLAFPAAVLVAASFSAMALCITSFVRRVEDFDVVMGLVVMPMFLFSGTFFPVSRFPDPLEWIVQAVPLYHAVEMLRQLTTGAIQPSLLPTSPTCFWPARPPSSSRCGGSSAP